MLVAQIYYDSTGAELPELGPVYMMPVPRRFDLAPVWNLLFFDPVW